VAEPASTRNGAGVVQESHDVSYLDAAGHYVNGNQTSDVFRRANPNAGAPCSAATCTESYTYDARDRVVEHRNGGSGVTSYALDPASNVTQEKLTSSAGGFVRDFTFKGNQIDTMSEGGASAKYNYDDGKLDCITSGATAGTCGTGAAVLQEYSYDYLKRLTGSKGGGSEAKYSHDALDRVSEQTESHSGQGARTTKMNYLGTSGAVDKEEHLNGTTPARTKSYSYDANGNATSMTDRAEGASPSEKSYTYGNDTHGGVSMLLDAAGKAAASYGYRPYGDDDSELSAGDTSKTNPTNPLRYTSKRYDSGSGTLDMGARRFSPKENHFLQEDRYAGALANLDLSLDPLTQNRYALAGGNPANFVEVDGHWSIPNPFKKTANWFNENKKEIGHGALDVIGLIPVVGEAADLANAAWYAKDGDYANAALSAASAVPVAGWGAAAAKVGLKHGDTVARFWPPTPKRGRQPPGL
jgi:RHS repeat-associated protein